MDALNYRVYPDVPPRVNVAEIRACDILGLCQVIARNAEKFYENPDNMKAFEEWKERRKKNL